MRAAQKLNVKAQIQVVVGLDREYGSIYIKPMLLYGSYLEIVAGGEYIAGNHYLIQKAEDKYRIERNEIQEILLRNYFKKFTYHFDFINDRYIGMRDDSLKIAKESLLPGLMKDYKIIYKDGAENISIRKDRVRISSNVVYNKGNGLFVFDLEFHCDNLKLTMDDLMILIDKGKASLNMIL